MDDIIFIVLVRFAVDWTLVFWWFIVTGTLEIE